MLLLSFCATEKESDFADTANILIKSQLLVRRQSRRQRATEAPSIIKSRVSRIMIHTLKSRLEKFSTEVLHPYRVSFGLLQFLLRRIIN